MYARNYSEEENLAALLPDDGGLSSNIPVVPCQDGWRFWYNEQEATTVVAEVSLRFTK